MPICCRLQSGLPYNSGICISGKIKRGAGITPSEQYLVGLANRTFLNLWSYPNLYVDRKTGGKGDGKELCDLLVVCGDDASTG